MKTAGAPITIVRGEGTILYSADGKQYIDAISSWWVNVHGHSHPHIRQKVSEQLATLEHVIFAGFTHPWAIELSERLLGMLPGAQGKVFFSDNGSTAVEVALKMALQFWWNRLEKRNKIIAFEHAYHGDTVGAMSAGGRGAFNAPFDEILFDVIHIPTPDKTNQVAVEELLASQLARGNVAAFIYEPVVQGAGGMRVYDREGMDRLLAMARKEKVLLIADEVMTGFGRTGKLFASEYYGTLPDIMTLSKALTGGTMPLAVTTCTDAVYGQFLSDDKKKTFFHGHSYTGNPTACAAALASLDLITDPAYRRSMERIERKHVAFTKELTDYSFLHQVRVQGTLLAFEIHSGGEDSYFHDIRDFLYDSFISQGVLLRPLGNTVYILPPMVITDEELDLVYRAIHTTLEKLRARLS
jgi:adenosylmethionine-8-amino-7-oxononanoate aminotransferase